MAKFNEYPAKTTPKDADKFMLYSAEDAANKLIDYDKLADAVLNKLTSKTFGLNQGTMTLPAALNQLNSNNLALQKRYLLKGIMAENEAKEFLLAGLSTYILVAANIGYSDVGNGDIALVVTGADSSHVSKIIWITNNCGHHDWFSFDKSNGLNFKIAIPSGSWVVVSLTAL